MQYNQPYGVSDPNAPYINGDPSVGQAGSIPPAASIEYPQREIANLISDAALLTPSNSDLHQLARSIQSTLLYSDDDAGTANQYQVTQTPPPTAYFEYMTVVMKVTNMNTGPSTLNVNALGAKPIVRVDSTPLQPGDLTAHSIVCLIYDGAAFQTVWSTGKGGAQGILTQNTTVYVNGATGDDSLYDGSSATVVAGTTHGPVKTIQKGINIAWTYRSSATYTVTVKIADGTYVETVATPNVSGPTTNVTGNTSNASAVVIAPSAALASGFTVNGPNVVNISYVKVQTANPNGAGFAANGAGASLNCSNTVSGPCAQWVFLGNGLGAVTIGAHTFAGAAPVLFACYRNGTITFSGFINITFSAAITVTYTAMCISGGQIEVPVLGGCQPVWVNPGNVTGTKYNAQLNGVVNSQGLGVNYFPGTVAGITSSGGQYG